MRLSIVIVSVLQVLLFPAVAVTAYLYLYPIVHGCGFPAVNNPTATKDSDTCFLDGKQANADDGAQSQKVAPFRLLALADPQLEGDTSLPEADVSRLANLKALWGCIVGLQDKQHEDNCISRSLRELFTQDVLRLLQSYRKRLDLIGNDFYLAHIYRSVKWWTQPTHTVVLGDLLGSQWISDEEFERRSDRFWKRVFRGARKVPGDIAAMGELDLAKEMFLHGRLAALDDEKGMRDWSEWLITVAGNHDIGYSGDIDERRIARFEKNFGPVNWETRMQLTSGAGLMTAESPPQLRLVMLNSMNIDAPAYKPELQGQTWRYVQQIMDRSQGTRPQDATVLLTHIPLHKEAGLCADGPFFTFFPPEQGGGISEQNHLGEQASGILLDGLFHTVQVPPRPHPRGIILNGHDHVGCDTYHYRLANTTQVDSAAISTIGNWSTAREVWARRFVYGKEDPGVREITVRSMMGSFEGNAGFLSGWFDEDAGHWRFEYDSCQLGVQHIWWAVHVLDAVVVGLLLALVPCALCDYGLDRAEERRLATETRSEKKTQ